MEKRKTPDIWLVGISAALVIAGILILASVASSFSLQRTGSPFTFLNHQLLFGLLPGIVLGGIAYLLPLETLRKWSLPLLIFNIFLLILVFTSPLGQETRGAHRWVFLGPFSFQPSEFLKLSFILYLAAWLTKRKERMLFPFLFMLGIMSVLLILQPDVSTLGIIGAASLLMYFLAPTPPWHVLAMLITGLAGLFVLIRIAPYRFSRLAVYLDPLLDPLGKGYQIKQALIGIGSGGLTGVGLGLSFQKFGTLPEPISDSIFAVFAEETGFLGALTMVLLFLLFALRCFTLAHRIQDGFPKLVAMGIASWITIQAFVNIGAMTALLPLAGIPLPFISYGGSSLVTGLISLGILLNISKHTDKR